MTMMQKMQAKKSKKGFTLVELVIVIAILAILAAIAIPVITTTINSAKLSTLDSDKTTVDMVLKECINTYKTGNTVTKYNTKTADAATVEDVFIEQKLDLKLLDSRTIGGTAYQIVWNGGAASIAQGGTGGTVITGATTMAQLSPM